MGLGGYGMAREGGSGDERLGDVYSEALDWNGMEESRLGVGFRGEGLDFCAVGWRIHYIELS